MHLTCVCFDALRDCYGVCMHVHIDQLGNDFMVQNNHINVFTLSQLATTTHLVVYTAIVITCLICCLHYSCSPIAERDLESKSSHNSLLHCRVWSYTVVIYTCTQNKSQTIFATFSCMLYVSLFPRPSFFA